MDILRLIKLRIKNFKGINDFVHLFDGMNAIISADNGIGKTSIMDAWFWLVFGCDSLGNAVFQLKPVDKDKNEIHHLETYVEAEIEINGKPVTLKKVFYERWVKKNGQANREFSGHTKDYYIDEVPKKESEFNKEVAELVNINAFKLVSDIKEFTRLNWQGQRNIVMEVTGDMSDDDVIKSDKELAALADILGDTSVDDYRKKIAAKQRNINKELNIIPAKIAENMEIEKDVEEPDHDYGNDLALKVDEAKSALMDLQRPEAIGQKELRIAQIDTEIKSRNSDAAAAVLEQKAPMNKKVDELIARNREIGMQIASLEDSITTDLDRNEKSLQAMENLVAMFTEINKEKPKVDTSCPYCEQPLPEDRVNAAVEKFNLDKSKKLDGIDEEGSIIKKNINDRANSVKESQAKIEKLTAERDAVNEELESTKEKLAAIKMEALDHSSIEAERDKLVKEIEDLKAGNDEEIQKAKDEITARQKVYAEWNKQQAAWEAAEKVRARIDELKKQEETLAAEYERLSYELSLLDKFVIRKVELLEDSINSQFKIVKFKLFREQINGGIDPCCEVTCEGVPYNTGLNNAMRINAGLDIVNTLSKHWGFSAPVFVDNKESVNSLLPIDAQVISLAVTRDKELVIRSAGEPMAKAS